MLPLYLAIGALAANSTKWGEWAAKLQSFGEDKYKDFVREWTTPTVEAKKRRNKFIFELGDEKSGKKYKVTLTLKKAHKDISLAEIDFADWGSEESKKLFDVSIVEKAEGKEPKAIGLENANAKWALERLRAVPLLLGHAKLYPDNTAEKVGASWDTGLDAADGVLNIFQKLADRIRELAGKDAIVRDQVVKQYGTENTHLSERQFIDRLLKVVDEKGRPDLLINYYKISQDQIGNHLEYVRDEIARRQKIVDKKEREKRKQLAISYLTIGISIGITLAVITSIVLLAIFVPLVGAVVAGIVGPLFGLIQGILPTLIKSPFASGAGFLSLIVIGIGVKRNLSVREKFLKEINEQKLSEAKELEEELEKGKKKIDDTIELTEELVRKSSENTTKFEFDNRDVEDIGIKLIARYLVSGKLSKCETISLANCGISYPGLDDFAMALMAQTEGSKCNVRNVDLTGNEIGIQGVEQIKYALSENITLVDVKLDWKYPRRDQDGKIIEDRYDEVSDAIRKEITRQLMINQYLQAVPYSKIEGAQEIFTTEAALQAAAIKKVEDNTDLTYVPFKVCQLLRKRVREVERQNRSLQKMLKLVSQPSAPIVDEPPVRPLDLRASTDSVGSDDDDLASVTLSDSDDDYVERELTTEEAKEESRLAAAFALAYKLDPKRCLEFVEEKGKKEGDFFEKAKSALMNHPLKMKRKKFGLDQYKGMIMLLKGEDIEEDEVKLIADFIDVIPDKTALAVQIKVLDLGDDRESKIKQFYGLVDQYLKTVLTEKMGYEEVKEKIDEFIKDVNDIFPASDGISLTQVLNMFINPDADPDDLKAIAIGRILDREVKDSALELYAPYDLKQFLDLFEELKPEYRQEKIVKRKGDYGFGNDDSDRLSDLIRYAVHNEISILQELDPEIRISLFELLYRSDTKFKEDEKQNHRKKAVLVSNMLDVFLDKKWVGNATVSGIYNKWFLGCFAKNEHGESWGSYSQYKYEQLVVGLKEQLKAAYEKGNYDLAAVIDRPLQAVVEDGLIKAYPWLQAGYSAESFAELKAAAKRGELDELRDLGFLEGLKLDEEARKYMENLIKKNQLKYIAENCKVNKITIAKFFEIYESMDPEFLAFEHIKQDKLKELIKGDVWHDSGVYCDKLYELDSAKCTKLLEIYFAGEEKAKQKAVIVANIIANKEAYVDDGKIKDTYYNDIYYAFFPTVVGRHIYTCVEIQGHLEAKRREFLGAANHEEVELIDHALQAVLQSDLKERYRCLSEAGTDGLDGLEGELNNNYELRSFSFPEGVEIDQKVKDCIKRITERNALSDFVENCPVSSDNVGLFFEKYKAMDPGRLSAPPVNLAKLKAYIEFDVYDKKKGKVVCHELQDLDHEHRTQLLALCFKGEEENERKARLVSKMIELIIPHIRPEHQIVKDLRDDLIKTSFINPGGLRGALYPYDRLLKELQEKRRVALLEAGKHKKYYPIVKLIDDVIQFEMQNLLEENFPILKGEGEASLESLRVDLRVNYVLRDFDFGDRVVDDAVKEYVTYICNRNKIIDIKNIYDRDGELSGTDIDNFMKYVNALKPEELKQVFESGVIQPIDILHIIEGDVGIYGTGRSYAGLGGRTWTVKSFDCRRLKALYDSDKDKFIELMTFALMHKDNYENARKKAALIGDLLSEGKLFETRSFQDPSYKKIIDCIYWAIVPKKEETGEHIDSLEGLMQNLNAAKEYCEAKKREDIVALIEAVTEAQIDLALPDSEEYKLAEQHPATDTIKALSTTIAGLRKSLGPDDIPEVPESRSKVLPPEPLTDAANVSLSSKRTEHDDE